MSETDSGTIQEPMNRLDALREEHHSLDVRINDLASRSYLSADDQVELARLKKLKLRKKDELFHIASEMGIEI